MQASRGRERFYLALTILNFVVVGGYTLWQSQQTGNLLFWTDPARTITEIFANGASTAFVLDLTGVVVAAFAWMAFEARRVGIPGVWRFWVLALLFGLAGPLPLFLYVRERRLRLAEGAAGGVTPLAAPATQG